MFGPILTLAITASKATYSMSKQSNAARPHWHPQFWPAWAGIFGLFLLSRLSMPAKQRWGRGIGKVLKRRLSGRAQVARTNIELCLPELDATQREQLVEDSFVACTRGFLETTHAWWGDMTPFEQSVTVYGKEHLDEAVGRGRGLLLIGGHYSIFDFALPLIASQLTRPGYMYRPNNNPVLDRVIEKGRRRHYGIRSFHKYQVGELIAFLKEGGQVWYACDQDFGRRTQLFTPFFGVETGCVTKPTRIARESGASVICVSHLRTPSGAYQITFSPIQEDFGKDQQADAATWNGFIEATIRDYPDQYLWLHKRFKTRPSGAARIY
jgi:KDO2-lipid IV(A) lauroyltransferase